MRLRLQVEADKALMSGLGLGVGLGSGLGSQLEANKAPS